MNTKFQEGYKYYARSAGTQINAFIESARIDKLNAEIAKLQSDIASLGTNKNVDFLSGDIAEFFHADTFNMDAILNGSRNRAEAPRLTSFGSPDIKLASGELYQVKYYADGVRSARAQSISLGEAARNSKTGTSALKRLAENNVSVTDPIYKGMKRLIPDEQLPDAKEDLRRKIAKEYATRPDEAERYSDAYDQLAGVVRDKDGITSKKLSREESKQLAQESKEGKLDLSSHGISSDQLVRAHHIAKASLRAGISAAAIAALLQTAPSIIACIGELQRDGSIDLDRLREDGGDVLDTSGSAFLTGSITAALTDMVQSGKLGEQLSNTNSAVIAAAAIMAFNAIRGGINVAKGNMDTYSYADSILRDAFISSCALTTGMLSQAACPIPAIGYMLGSFIGSAVGGLTYQVGKQAFISFLVDRGATFFGLVEQDYELPESIMREIGLDVFQYDEFVLKESEVDFFVPDEANIETIREQFPIITLPRRGVIAVGKAGYVM